MDADLGVPLSDLRLLCGSVAGGVSRKTFTQFSKCEKLEKRESLLVACQQGQHAKDAATNVPDAVVGAGLGSCPRRRRTTTTCQ